MSSTKCYVMLTLRLWNIDSTNQTDLLLDFFFFGLVLHIGSNPSESSSESNISSEYFDSRSSWAMYSCRSSSNFVNFLPTFLRAFDGLNLLELGPSSFLETFFLLRGFSFSSGIVGSLRSPSMTFLILLI